MPAELRNRSRVAFLKGHRGRYGPRRHLTGRSSFQGESARLSRVPSRSSTDPVCASHPMSVGRQTPAPSKQSARGRHSCIRPDPGSNTPLPAPTFQRFLGSAATAGKRRPPSGACRSRGARTVSRVYRRVRNKPAARHRKATTQKTRRPAIPGKILTGALALR